MNSCYSGQMFNLAHFKITTETMCAMSIWDKNDLIFTFFIINYIIEFIDPVYYYHYYYYFYHGFGSH